MKSATMKSATTVLALLCGFAVALPTSINHNTEPDSHHFAPVTRIHPSFSASTGGDVEQPIDNRPQLPSPLDSPSVVLASPKPVPSSYLLNLPLRDDVENGASLPAADTVEEAAPVTASENVMRAAHGARSWAAQTCGSRHYYVNIAALVVVAILLTAVVVCESLEYVGSCFQSASTSEGRIRLDIEATAASQSLSIQACDEYLERDTTESEKDGL